MDTCHSHKWQSTIAPSVGPLQWLLSVPAGTPEHQSINLFFHGSQRNAHFHRWFHFVIGNRKNKEFSGVNFHRTINSLFPPCFFRRISGPVQVRWRQLLPRRNLATSADNQPWFRNLWWTTSPWPGLISHLLKRAFRGLIEQSALQEHLGQG